MPAVIGAVVPDQRNALVDTIRAAASALANGWRVHLDFSRVKVILPGGMLLLVSFLEIALGRHAGKLQARCPVGSLSGQLFVHFGLATRLGVSVDRNQPTADSVVNWRYIQGTKADGSQIHELIEYYRSLPGTWIPDGLYDVVAEALTNVVHHAYPDPDGPPDLPVPHLRKWWIFASRREPSGKTPGSFYLGVYDLGAGIQWTMRRKLHRREVILDAADPIARLVGAGGRVRRYLDRLLLQRAVERNDSSTGLGFRGKGLPEMLSFVRANPGATLYIQSAEAQYACFTDGSGHSVESLSPLLGLRGTLILWQLPLTREEPAHE